MNDLPLFIRIPLFILLAIIAGLVGITTLQTKEKGLNNAETPREILCIERGENNPRLGVVDQYAVLMNDRSVKKFVDIGSDGIVDEVLRPDNVGWTEEFKDDQKRAKAMFEMVLKLTTPAPAVKKFPRASLNVPSKLKILLEDMSIPKGPHIHIETLRKKLGPNEH